MTTKTTTKTPEEIKAEQEAAKKAEEKRVESQKMLKKIVSKRVPRVLQGISSIGALGAHKPTEAQQKTIVDALKKAVAEVESELKGTTKAAPSFSIPD